MEFNGFLWNNDSGINLNDSGIVEQGNLFVRKPFVGHFEVVMLAISAVAHILCTLFLKVKGVSFLVASVHLKAENWGGKDKKRVEVRQFLELTMQAVDHNSLILCRKKSLTCLC